jgi:hypothetical protein
MLPTRSASRGTLRFLAPPLASGTDEEKARFPFPAGEERRRHPRISASALEIAFAGERFTTVDWSLGGLTVGGYEGKLTIGALFTIDRLATVDGGVAAVRICARVLRRDRQRQRLTIGFLHMDRRAFAVLEAWMADRTGDPENLLPLP